MNHLDTPDDHPLIEIEDLIEKTCGIHKRIKSENPGQDKPNPEFKLVKLLVRELAREKRLRWGPSVGGHKLRPDRDA